MSHINRKAQFLLSFISLLAGTLVGVVVAQDREAAAKQTASVYKHRISPHWFSAGDQFWYRNELSGGRREFIVVDAVRGERKLAFDHQRLAGALQAAGVDDVQPERLQLEALEFDDELTSLTFRLGDAQSLTGNPLTPSLSPTKPGARGLDVPLRGLVHRIRLGSQWRCELADYKLTPIQPGDVEAGETDAAINPLDAPRASRETGRETEITFHNQTDRDVELWWLDQQGRRRSYGIVAPGQQRRQHTFAGHVWLAISSDGRTLAAFKATASPLVGTITGLPIPRRANNRKERGADDPGSVASPDDRWLAGVRDGNLIVRAADAHAEDAIQLTDNDATGTDVERVWWSPDSRSIATFGVRPGANKHVFLVESSPAAGGRAILHQRPYALPGDRLDRHEFLLFRLKPHSDSSTATDQRDENWQLFKPDVPAIELGRPRPHFSPDGGKVRLVHVDRGHQRWRLVEVDVQSGQTRNLIDERADTFIWTAHTEQLDCPKITWLEDSDEVIYQSEVDGWRQLYLCDLAAADVKSATHQISIAGRRLKMRGFRNRITNGEWIVRGIDQIDEAKRQVWFRASGLDANQDPYLVHHCRVNFDGTGFVRLTRGDGDHSIQFSPDRRFIIDTYSRVDMPPKHELRSADDGRLICQLEVADISELKAEGWDAPEVFHAKGRDGQTDIWGIICRPQNFDPNRRYAVIEEIYAGPHGAFVPKRFSPRSRYEALNELGFIVVKIDGMGTAHRSKSFHDVCWQNLKDAGFADRICWLEAAATADPALDLNRLGIYGVSAGGQNAAAAMLFHPHFYRAAVAACGCHDNRMDKASWNEQWMGYPVGTQYSASSNVDHAHRLEGELLLIVGEMDRNVPPESTLRLADALIRAEKVFDLLVVPGAGHGIGGDYGRRKMHDFFVRHLFPADFTPLP